MANIFDFWGKPNRPGEPTKLTKQEAIKRLSLDFKSCESQEVVRIVSGELNCEIWNHASVENSVQNAIHKRRINLKCIAGPLISVDDNGDNTILNLALDKKIELYLAPHRMLIHYRVFGDRFVYIENYHQAIEKADNREGYYAMNEDGFGKSEIRRYTDDFDSRVELLHLKKIASRDQVLALRNDEIQRVKESALEKRVIYDDLSLYKLREIWKSLSDEHAYA